MTWSSQRKAWHRQTSTLLNQRKKHTGKPELLPALPVPCVWTARQQHAHSRPAPICDCCCTLFPQEGHAHG